MDHTFRTAAAVVLAWGGVVAGAAAQTVDFKVAWSTIGEVAAAAGNERAKAGRQVLTAAELTAMSQRGARVTRVDVAPPVVEVRVGQQVCIGSLQIHAFGADRRPVAGAPLSVVVREDQKLQLQLTRPKDDICMRPAQPGEYPIRFTSKLPAADSTLRGAQVFLRAK